MFRFDLSLLSSPSFSSAAKTWTQNASRDRKLKHYQHGKNKNSHHRQYSGNANPNGNAKILACPLTPVTTRTSNTLGTMITDDLTRSTTATSFQSSSAVEVLFLPPPSQQLCRSGPIAGRSFLFWNSGRFGKSNGSVNSYGNGKRGTNLFQPATCSPPPRARATAKATTAEDIAATVWKCPPTTQSQSKGERKQKRKRKRRSKPKKSTPRSAVSSASASQSQSPASFDAAPHRSSGGGGLLQRLLRKNQSPLPKPPDLPLAGKDYNSRVQVRVEHDGGVEITRQRSVDSTIDGTIGTSTSSTEGPIHSRSPNRRRRPRSLFRKHSSYTSDTTTLSLSSVGDGEEHTHQNIDNDGDNDNDFHDNHDEELRVMVDRIWMATGRSESDDDDDDEGYQSTVEEEANGGIEFQELPECNEAEPPTGGVDAVGDCNLMMFVNIEHKVLEYTSDEFQDFD